MGMLGSIVQLGVNSLYLVGVNINWTTTNLKDAMILVPVAISIVVLSVSPIKQGKVTDLLQISM